MLYPMCLQTVVTHSPLAIARQHPAAAVAVARRGQPQLCRHDPCPLTDGLDEAKTLTRQLCTSFHN
jgi:hypothetical protein